MEQPKRPTRLSPFRLLAREQIALLLRKARAGDPPPSSGKLKAQLRELLAGLKVGSYRRRVVREEMKAAGAPLIRPPDLRQLELPWGSP